MKKMSIACLAFAVNIFSAAAFGATGEYWEITSKMEMPGMPFAMPATTSKVCLPPGGEKDPARTRDKSKDCEMTDVKTSGNKVSYKGKCTDQNGTMNMEGENTYDRDSYNGTMHMTGKSHGRDMNMKMTSSGKRIGGSCDPEELGRKMQAQAKEQEKEIKDQMAKRCDTSSYNTNQWVSAAIAIIGPNATCPNNKEALCQVIRNDVPHDLHAFETLMQQEQIKGMPSAAKACNVSLESIKVSTCKANVKKAPLSFLDANCPAEAKAAREDARRRAIYEAKYEDCAGRGYTSDEEKLKKCIAESTAMPENENADSDTANIDAGKANISKADGEQKTSGKPGRKNKSKADDEQKDSEKPTKENNPAEAVLEGAKKLKGLFRF